MERIPHRTAYLGLIEEHVRTVQRMVQAGADRVAVITQVKAIRRMHDAFNARVLEDHLNGCVTTAIRSKQPEERERVMKELLNVLDTAHTLEYQRETKAEHPEIKTLADAIIKAQETEVTQMQKWQREWFQ